MKNVSTVMSFTDKTFVDDKGVEVPYLEITAKINGEPVRFFVKREDKSLLRALLRAIPEVK